ncbi:MAG TPA: SLBB domain-containing protein, partial [Lamprocystis sp. (in: g-proteobacteria)]|nr:SLBB domain-containing protein [Lamprocystis sp. (in: g-proteobacteria)]
MLVGAVAVAQTPSTAVDLESFESVPVRPVTALPGAVDPDPNLETAAAQDAAPLQVGDVLRIDLPGEDSLNIEFPVDRQGRIRLPEVGYLKVEGLTLAAAQQRIHLALSQVLRDLSRLSVVREESKVLVKVLGYVGKPGLVTLDADGGVQSALEAAGGLKPGAQLDRMQVRRGAETIRFDFKHYLDSGDPTAIPRLQSLDELFVPASPFVGNVEGAAAATKVGETGDAAGEDAGVKVFGEVRSPGMFSYKPSMTIVDALMRAQGVTNFAAVDQIRLISDGEPKKFNLTAYLDRGDRSLLLELQPGATVFVPRQQEEIKVGRNTVYVMGEVARNGAFQNSDDATFMDILANAGGPTRYAETRNITILRADGSVERFD